MADRLESFSVTVAASTSFAAPFPVLSFRDGIVRNVEMLFPDGCLGLVKAQLLYAGVSILPSTTGAFATGNAYNYDWSVDGQPTGRQWQVNLQNADIYPHTLEIRFHVDELSIPQLGSGVALPAPPGGEAGGDTGESPPGPGGEPPPASPPGGAGPESPGGPSGLPPIMMPTTEEVDMIVMMLHDGTTPSHTEVFGVWASGMVRQIGPAEQAAYTQANVQLRNVGSQTEYGLLLRAALAVAPVR